MDKKNIQDSFDTGDMLFTAKMDLAGLENLVSDDFEPPTRDDITGYSLFPKKKNWLKNCILTATLDTNAYPNLDLKIDGWENMKILRTTYLGPNYKSRRTIWACNRLAKLELTRKGNLITDSFVAQFQIAMKFLRNSGTPYPEELQRTTFMKKVRLPLFDAWKDLQREKDSSQLTMSTLF